MTFEPNDAPKRKVELKDFDSFKAAFAEILTPEHIRTIRYGAQEYLFKIERDIQDNLHSVPANRSLLDNENLTFLYTTAAACSDILFRLGDLANEHGQDL